MFRLIYSHHQADRKKNIYIFTATCGVYYLLLLYIQYASSLTFKLAQYVVLT